MITNFLENIKLIFVSKNKKDRFKKLFDIILILIALGLIRLFLEVLFNIDLNGKWYSFDTDIIFVMSVFPFYLTFFLTMVTHLIFKLFKIDININKLLFLFFFFQFFHILIPFLDFLGNIFEIPHTFEYYNTICYGLNPFEGTSFLRSLVTLTPLVIFYTCPDLITLGISVSWLIAGFIFFNFLVKKLKISISKSLIIIIIIFQIIYWPIYRYFVVFDNLFRYLTKINYYNHYGYGLYFLIFGIIGLIYYNYTREKKL